MVVRQIDLKSIEPGPVPFSCSRFIVEPFCSSPEDIHSVREIWIVMGGWGELNYDGRMVNLSLGDAVYFPPMKSHCVHNPGPVTLAIVSIWW
jgi:mannose-6-phosphate isomerase-like protein (cupin superfamily)